MLFGESETDGVSNETGYRDYEGKGSGVRCMPRSIRLRFQIRILTSNTIMGQANRRGTFEERREAALKRQEEEWQRAEEKRAAEERAALAWWETLTPEEQEAHRARVAGKRRSRMMIAGLVVGALMSF